MLKKKDRHFFWFKAFSEVEVEASSKTISIKIDGKLIIKKVLPSEKDAKELEKALIERLKKLLDHIDFEKELKESAQKAGINPEGIKDFDALKALSEK